MFIDFLTLVMINLVAGTVLLAYYHGKALTRRISAHIQLHDRTVEFGHRFAAVLYQAFAGQL